MIKRRADGKVKMEINDILKLFEEIDKKNYPIPKFLAENYDSFPPINGFSLAARNISALLDRIEALNKELEEFRVTKNHMLNSFGQQADIKLELGDIKRKVNSIEKHLKEEPQKAPITQNYQPLPIRSFAEVAATNIRGAHQGVRDQATQGMGNTNNRNTEFRNQNLRTGSGPSYRPSVKNHRPPSQPGRIFGTKISSTEGGLRSSGRNMDLFIGRCELNTTIEDIKSHCRDSCNVNVIECIDLQSKSQYFKSFKINVSLSDRNRLLAPELWPEGIIVKKFFRRRSQTLNESNNSEVMNASFTSAHISVDNN